MVDRYPLPGRNITGLPSYFEYVSSVSEGYFFPIVLLVIAFVLFIATKQFSTRTAFTFTSFIIALLAIPLTILGYLANQYMYLSIFCVAAGLIWLRFSSDRF